MDVYKECKELTPGQVFEYSVQFEAMTMIKREKLRIVFIHSALLS